MFFSKIAISLFYETKLLLHLSAIDKDFSFSNLWVLTRDLQKHSFTDAVVQHEGLQLY